MEIIHGILPLQVNRHGYKNNADVSRDLRAARVVQPSLKCFIDSLLDPSRESLHGEGASLTLRFVHGDRQEGAPGLFFTAAASS
jgi:hypothetical protein